jgi:hypothetical protein
MNPSRESIALLEALHARSPAASMVFDAEQEKVPPEFAETLRIWASHVFLEVFNPEAYSGPDRERELALNCWERVLGKEES